MRLRSPPRPCHGAASSPALWGLMFRKMLLPLLKDRRWRFPWDPPPCGPQKHKDPHGPKHISLSSEGKANPVRVCGHLLRGRTPGQGPCPGRRQVSDCKQNRNALSSLLNSGVWVTPCLPEMGNRSKAKFQGEEGRAWEPAEPSRPSPHMAGPALTCPSFLVSAASRSTHTDMAALAPMPRLMRQQQHARGHCSWQRGSALLHLPQHPLL